MRRPSWTAWLVWAAIAVARTGGATSRTDQIPSLDLSTFPQGRCRNATLHLAAPTDPRGAAKTLTSSQYLMTSRCPASYDVTDVRAKCTVWSRPRGDFDRVIPVTSAQNNVTYANRFCALCHGQLTSLITWSLNISCREYVDVTSASTAGKLLEVARESAACAVELWAPPGVEVVPCGPFALPHHDLELPPLSILLDFNPQTPQTQGGSGAGGGGRCQAGKWLNPLKDTCLPLHCHSGRKLTEDGRRCRSVMGAARGLVYRLALTLTPTDHAHSWQNPACRWQDAVADHVTKWPALLHSEVWRGGVAGKVSEELSSPQLLAALEFAVSYPTPRDLLEATALNLTHTPVSVNCGPSVVRFDAAPYLGDLDFPLDIGTTGSADTSVFTAVYGPSPDPPQPIIISDFLLCPYVILEESDFLYDVSSGQIHLHNDVPFASSLVDYGKEGESTFPSTETPRDGSRKRGKYLTLDASSFVLEASGKAKVCRKSLDDLCRKHLQVQGSTPSLANFNLHKEVQKYFSFACTVLSLAGLALTFVTYCLFPVLRTLPGKNNMCLVVNLFLAQGLAEFGMGRTESPLVCVVLGVLVHYSWLAAIFWMNVCSFHMFRVFTRKRTPITARKSDLRRLALYLVYAQGVPVVIVTATMTVSLALSGHVGYGGGACYLTTPLLVGVSFAAPLGLILLANAVFFTLATWAIGSSESLQGKGMAGSRHNLFVYVRLASVTGLFWSAALLAEAFQLEALHYVSVILNGSQGLLLALAFVTTARVLSLYRDSLAALVAPKPDVTALPSVTSVSGMTFDSSGTTLSTRV